MDEIDAIGARRFSEGTSADREIQRTLMELLNQVRRDLRVLFKRWVTVDGRLRLTRQGEDDHGDESTRHT